MVTISTAGTGIDRMDGGFGDDTFVVDEKTDRVIETTGGGMDTVFGPRQLYPDGRPGDRGPEGRDPRLDRDAQHRRQRVPPRRIYGNNGTNTLNGLNGDDDKLYGYNGSDYPTAAVPARTS